MAWDRDELSVLLSWLVSSSYCYRFGLIDKVVAEVHCSSVDLLRLYSCLISIYFISLDNLMVYIYINKSTIALWQRIFYKKNEIYINVNDLCKSFMAMKVSRLWEDRRHVLSNIHKVLIIVVSSWICIVKACGSEWGR